MPRSQHPPRGRVSGFTLIELMIVVSILGILAGLMTGVISSVQNSAKRNECLNNLRQWGGAMSMYLDEHRSRTFPTYEADANSDTAWFNVLPPYLEKSSASASYKEMVAAGKPLPHPGEGAKSIFLCPLDDGPAEEMDPKTYYSSYTMNIYVDSSENSKPRSKRLRDSQLKFPSAFVVMTEACDGRVGGATSGMDQNLVMTGGGSTAFRHNKSINLLFADGHAATMPQSAIWSDSMQKGDNLGDIQWNPNKDLQGNTL